jgi:uncharacterized protein (DUF1800 family)
MGTVTEEKEKKIFMMANRFGFSLKPGEMARLFTLTDPVLLLNNTFDSVSKALHRATYRKTQDRLRLRPDWFKGEPINNPDYPGQPNVPPHPSFNYRLHTHIRTYHADSRTRFARIIKAPAENTFVERLTQFWSNHFTVHMQPGTCFVHDLVIPFEEEAIARNLFRPFEEMLIAVVKHPAMILYLDNDLSSGLNSKTAKDKPVLASKMNENLAREILELHTVSPEAGYDLEDIQNLANALTGWRCARNPLLPYGFEFFPDYHEPGAKTVMGFTTHNPINGVTEAEQILRFLARHPATARHVCTKLLQHFYDDNPPKSMIDKLVSVWVQSNGFMYSVIRTMLSMPEMWDTRVLTQKLKTPNDLIFSMFRAIFSHAPIEQHLSRFTKFTTVTEKGATFQIDNGYLQYQLFGWWGQLPFTAPDPRGWPDTKEAWLGQDSLLQRITLIQQHAIDSHINSSYPEYNALILGDDILKPVLKNATRTKIEDFLEIGYLKSAMTTLLASPEFIWR